MKDRVPLHKNENITCLSFSWLCIRFFAIFKKKFTIKKSLPNVKNLFLQKVNFMLLYVWSIQDDELPMIFVEDST